MKSQITRPKPSAEWSFEWRRVPARTDAQTVERTSVHASFAADTPDAYVPAGEDVDDVAAPNNITIQHTVDRRERATFRLTRDAAAQLVEALTAALEWSGR